MAYEKTTWAAGDVVTAAKLNNLESGVANAGASIVSINLSTGALDIAAGDLFQAVKSGVVIAQATGNNNGEYLYNCIGANVDSSGYYDFYFFDPSGQLIRLTASSANDYPVAEGANNEGNGDQDIGPAL